jgi:hypothetical protein
VTGENPVVDRYNFFPQYAEWSGTEVGSYPTLEWIVTITRYQYGDYSVVGNTTVCGSVILGSTPNSYPKYPHRPTEQDTPLRRVGSEFESLWGYNKLKFD